MSSAALLRGSHLELKSGIVSLWEHRNESTYPSTLPEVGCIMITCRRRDIASFRDDYLYYNVHDLAGVSRKRLAHFKTNVYLARSQVVRIPSARLTDSLNRSKHAWQRSYMNSKHVKSTESSAVSSFPKSVERGLRKQKPRTERITNSELYESMNLLEFTPNCRMIGS